MQPKLNEIVYFVDNLRDKGDYWQYLAPDFADFLQNYLEVFEHHRQEIGVIPMEDDWKQLPFGKFAKDSSWKWRRQSLEIIQHLTKDKLFETTLEIGAWNGWLTKFLAQNSKTVIATDYFVCPLDGISNIQVLSKNIIAVQCNLEKISTEFRPESFDLIVLNHHLSYMNNPVDYIKNLIPLLKPKGMIIAVGNAFFRNPEKKIQANNAIAEQFHKKYDRDLYIQPVKGYMTFEDINSLKDLHFEIRPYNAKFLQNMYSKWNASAPFYAYLFYQKPT